MDRVAIQVVLAERFITALDILLGLVTGSVSVAWAYADTCYWAYADTCFSPEVVGMSKGSVDTPS